MRERDTTKTARLRDVSRRDDVDLGTAILAAKLCPPRLKEGFISRAVLVERLMEHDVEPLVAVVAPPGYGKTTLLAEWASNQERPVAWVSIDEDDNDSSVLLAVIAIALSRVRWIDAEVLDAVSARTMEIPRALAMLMSALGPAPAVTLVLDNVDSVGNGPSLDLIAELAWRLPPGLRLVYASRTPLPLPIPLLRSRGVLVEIGSADLAMDRREARSLLTAAGADLGPDEVEGLFEQTEGWPAGLYLGGLASKGRRPGSPAFAFRGDDVLMGDYLRSEILSQLPRSTVVFLTRTSVLEQLSGPLCDAVMGMSGSQTLLESLEFSNLMLVALDRQRAWYRYHRLFRDLLATELERREPALVAELHGRAARWLEDHGMPELAIRHAQRSGAPDLVVRLVAAATQPAYAGGRATDVRAWLEWFRTENLIDRHPHVAVRGALVEALSGRPASAERWASAAEAAEADADHEEAFKGSLAYMRSVLCRRGTARMRNDARLAQETLGARSDLRAGAFLFEALSHLLDGDRELADPLLVHAYDVAVYMKAMPAVAASLAFRGAIAISRSDWDDAQVLADEAVSIIEAGHLQDYVESGIVYAVAARTASHRADARTASHHLTRAARIRPLLTYAVPALVLVQLELARAYLQVADPTGASTVLREVRDILYQRPDLGAAAREADELHLTLEAIRQRPVGASSLTAAELRLLPFLATHLSLPEIGDRLHVSRHTVKTQAISLYRKLGASSRSEAIERAHDVGLLGL